MTASVTRVPASLDLRALHERCNNSIAAVPAIVRVLPMPDELEVHVHLTVQFGKGMTTLRLILPPDEARQLVVMVNDALMVLGERDA